MAKTFIVVVERQNGNPMIAAKVQKLLMVDLVQFLRTLEMGDKVTIERKL